ncbi:MAG: hypothetical protein ACP5NW_03990 [Candidatus Woesearchaeota archaeon]
MTENANGIINPTYAEHLHEDTVLEHISSALHNNYFNNREDLKEYVLNPDLVGRVLVKRESDDTFKENSIGLSYARTGKIGDSAEISGFVLDNTGIGIIKGVESIINGTKRLNFTRKNINVLGLVDKNDSASYNLFLPRGENTFIGESETTGGKTGIELHMNNGIPDKSILVLKYYLKESYNKFVKFVKDFELRQEY